ncbi:hypothetical protein F4553_000411 [Allocatelliglobosispora scoriae]|uniref:Uncharacterized protein n=1 Tax=Allocatelliglobosispora scoriae TaxID=643052 RepID=A0A841BJS9_9ACTN|nr:hypothetical protein [Allocatelliglobosispora scoriae]MBB5867032.1 hypothetical protein [Allocatelliglobosispora scoriae]
MRRTIILAAFTSAILLTGTACGSIFTLRVLYSGFAKGTYKGGTTSMWKVLVDLKADISSYQAYLKKILPTVTTAELKAAITSDIAAWAKHTAALKAAGTDYKGKVLATLDGMQTAVSDDDRFGHLCSPS